MAGGIVEGFFQSRMFTGEVGTPAAGRYGFEYRIDITEVGAVTGASCISALTIDFGPVVPMDFAGDGQAADGYVVVQGGLGSIAPSDVTQRDNQINVRFLSPKICASGRPGGSPTTFRVLVARPCWRGVTGTLGTASAAVPAWPVRWFADRNWS
jgi:hypothetical protein